MQIDHGETGRSPAERAGKARLCCLMLAAAVGLSGYSTFRKVQEGRQGLARQEAQIQELEQAVKETEAAEPDPGQENRADPETERRQQDGQAAATFLAKLLTWKDYESYQGVRAWLSQDLGIGEGDPLLTVFLPSANEGTLGDANMALAEADPYLLSADGDGMRSYFALCRVTNKTDGNTGYGNVGVFYTLSPEGQVSGVSASVLQGR